MRGLLAPKFSLQKALRVLGLITLALVSTTAYAADTKAPIRILAFGDSLTAGYGLTDPAEAFPVQLEKALKDKGYNVAILPGGISGDTTSGGRSRLDWSLEAKPDAVIVELGGNDALRAIDPKITADNLNAIVRGIQKAGLPILIVGMLAPPNLGRDFEDRFNAIYPKLAADTGAPLYPFFLEGAITQADLMQNDHIHPNAKGVQVIVAKMLPAAEKLVGQVTARRAAAAK